MSEYSVYKPDQNRPMPISGDSSSKLSGKKNNNHLRQGFVDEAPESPLVFGAEHRDSVYDPLVQLMSALVPEGMVVGVRSLNHSALSGEMESSLKIWRSKDVNSQFTFVFSDDQAMVKPREAVGLYEIQVAVESLGKHWQNFRDEVILSGDHYQVLLVGIDQVRTTDSKDIVIGNEVRKQVEGSLIDLKNMYDWGFLRLQAEGGRIKVSFLDINEISSYSVDEIINSAQRPASVIVCNRRFIEDLQAAHRMG